MTDDDTLAQLVRLAVSPADLAVINQNRPGVTPADRTRTAVEAAFRFAIEQGLIEVKPPDQWPDYVEW